MNGLVIVSGVLAVGIVLGHCTLGRRDFFLPMLATQFDPYAKRIMEFVWHMATLSLVLMALALLVIGFGYVAEGAALLGGFVVAHYLGWGLLHLLLGVTSGLPRAPLRLFQWIFFLAVAVTAGLGLATA